MNTYQEALESGWERLDSMKPLTKKEIKESNLTSINKTMLLCYYGHNHTVNPSLFYMAVYSSNIPSIIKILVINGHYPDWSLYCRNVKIYTFLEKIFPIDKENNNAYLMSITRGDTELFKYLHGTNHNMSGNNMSGNNDVLIAGANDRRDILEFLRIKNADFNKVNNAGEDLTYIACKHNLHYILTTYCSRDYHRLGITYAAELGYLECLRHFNYNPMQIKRIFFIAAKLGHYDNLVWILQTWPELKNSVSNGYNALHIACAHNRINNVRLLSEHIGINSTAHNGDTALHMACYAGNSIEMIDVLVDLGADVHMKNIYSDTPLSLCSNAEVFSYLENIINRGHYARIMQIPEGIRTIPEGIMAMPEGIRTMTITLNETCNICYETRYTEYIHCSKKHYVCKECWIKARVNHCLYCYEEIL